MSPGDVTGTIWVNGQEVTLTAEEVRAALRTGTPPGQPAAPTASPARERLMSDLEARGFVLEVPFRGQSGRRLFRFDAADPRRRVAVDYHGFGGGGAHTYRGKKAGDADKLNEAQLCGWTYLVCDAISVNSGRCLRQVDTALKRAKEEPCS